MKTPEKTTITVETTVAAPIEKVWKCWIEPEHIIHWNAASDDWHTPTAENDFRVGGKYTYRMEAKDGSFGFDFWGIYDDITLHKTIANTLGDGRKMKVTFESVGHETRVIEAFEAESQNPIEMQRFGWQSILDRFKNYVEGIQ